MQSERKRLLQTETLRDFQREFRPQDLIDVYRMGKQFVEVSCALLPENQLEETHSSNSWYIHQLEWGPEVKYSRACGSHLEYLRFGNYEGIEPLVISRSFHEIRPSHVEICEDFRLFHNLYHDRKNDCYIKIDDSGNEDRIVVIEPKKVKIRFKELRQYLTVKNMYLAIQFDRDVWSNNALGELGLTEGLICKNRDESSWWKISCGDAITSDPSNRSFSRFLGIRLFPPLEPSKSGIPGVAEGTKDEHVDFIVGFDVNGNAIGKSGAPSAMVGRPGDYLIPVSFRRTVLDKYHEYPTKFKISNGAVWCGSLWGLRIDDHHDHQVTVLLGDLGLLPYEEQLHWRAHNFVSEEGYSEEYYQSQIEAEFVTSDRPEHVFHALYFELADVCDNLLGWRLILPLRKEDEYHLQNIRVPATSEQRGFDELILSLTKTLIDSLNESRLRKLIPECERESIVGSISWLEAALSACGVRDAREHIAFLRNLQDLRSAGAAHRKGRKYRKIAAKFGVGEKDLRLVFTGILRESVLLLKYLIGLVREKRCFQSATDN